MPHPCVVCGRSRMNPNNRVEEYTFFGFPVNDEPRCKKWLEFCCREELYKLTKKQLLQRMVCSKHFLPSDFVNDFFDRLNSSAVPSIYDPKQSLYNISCILCGRFRKNPPGSENDDATFHHFPGEEFRCLNWLDFVGVDSYYRLTRKEIIFCYICSKHFHKNQFMPGFINRLIDSAVPTFRCPDENVNEESAPLSNPPTDVELFNSCEKNVINLDPLPTAVLESQACIACGRLRTDPKNKKKYKFHPFPAYEIGRCLKWCQFLEREDILKMSPNQIRKLVLCSRHFRAGQNFNNGSGPCDAIPTIKDCDSDSEIVSTPTSRTEVDSEKVVKVSVSSKKPKMDPDSKPMPLAKKRGKSKRPTIINIPRIETKVDNYVVKKLPIPTASNWKFIANQFQPITVTSNIMNNMSEVKKVILPFSGNISSLGAPIPVDSLSSIPPGFLIKIDLPDQKNESVKPVKRKIRKKSSNQQVESLPIICNDVENKIKIEPFQENVDQVPSNNINEFLMYTEDSSQLMHDDIEFEQVVEKEEKYTEEFERIDIKDVHTDVEDVYFEEVQEEVVPVEETKPKKMSRRCRRTLLPIEIELRNFLAKLKPQVRRLPKKAQAQVKLAIINKVIERL